MWSVADFARSLWQQAGVQHLLLLVAVAVAAHCVYEALVTLKGDSQPRKLRPKWTLPLLYNSLHVALHKHHYADWVVAQLELFKQPFWLRMLGGPDILIVNTPEHFEDVLKTHFEAFAKGERMNGNLRDLLGAGIFGVDGHRWVHQRKTASNLFSLRALRESMAESIQKHALVLNGIFERIADDAEDQLIDLFRLLNRFTMETFAEIGFGVELGALTVETEDHPFQAAFDGAQRILMLRFVRPAFVWKTLRWLNVGVERELRDHMRMIDDMVLGIISQALTNRASQTPASYKSGKKDIVSLFLDNVSANTKEQNDAFDPVFLRDIVVNFLIAGRDTTAQALSWFFFLLSENPSVEAKIRQELAEKLPDLAGNKAARVSMEQSGELVYLEAAIRETLRLHPSVPLNSRQAQRDVVLSDGTLIKKGNAVSISSYVLARMTHVWGEDAKEFHPERWLDPQSGKLITVSAFKFTAFHAGPRTCLGMNLAMMEMKIVAAMVLSRFHLELVPGQDVTYDLSLTHPIKGELLMKCVPVKQG